MEPQSLKSALESILFVSNKPLKIKEIAKILEQQEFAVQAAVDKLMAERKDSGVVVLENNGEYQLATSPSNSSIVKNFLNAELREKLTDATVEVLAIIAYRQPISKAEIESIRGVNSQYSLRSLLMRGLIEKISNPGDARSFLYQTTTEFLMHLGLNSTKELPEFEKLVEHIKLPETPQLQSADQPVSLETPPEEIIVVEEGIVKDPHDENEDEDDEEDEE
jgi:segregation and condensation protein B